MALHDFLLPDEGLLFELPVEDVGNVFKFFCAKYIEWTVMGIRRRYTSYYFCPNQWLSVLGLPRNLST